MMGSSIFQGGLIGKAHGRVEVEGNFLDLKVKPFPDGGPCEAK
jgi:hypothetical protein